MRAPTVCSEPGCGELTDRGRCAECEREAGRRARARRKRPADPADRNWRKIRGSYLKRHPKCECDDCALLPEEQRPAAVDVDHIIARPEGSHKDSNLRSMAKSHHSKRTARDQPGGWNAFRR